MFSLRVPPLRERKEDIPLLVEHFLSRCSKEFGRTSSVQISPEAIAILMKYDWPGNVRELKGLFAKICLLEDSQVILPEHVSARLEIASEPPAQFPTSIPDSGLSLGEVEKNLIRETLRKANGNMKKAAKLLNVTYDTLRYRMKKFEIR
jgi:DNA-binding NtrC family response regulator